MSKMRLKLIVAVVVVGGAVSFLASASIKSGWVYYLEVDKYLADSQYKTQRVRLHGKVAEEAFSVSTSALTANFNLLGHTGKVPVTYKGVIPDMFQAGRDVVVEGKLNESGAFQADVLLTKCASKYESGSPHENKKEKE
jgi:cytochrome c-type biogenesis protein CcmE